MAESARLFGPGQIANAAPQLAVYVQGDKCAAAGGKIVTLQSVFECLGIGGIYGSTEFLLDGLAGQLYQYLTLVLRHFFLLGVAVLRHMTPQC